MPGPSGSPGRPYLGALIVPEPDLGGAFLGFEVIVPEPDLGGAFLGFALIVPELDLGFVRVGVALSGLVRFPPELGLVRLAPESGLVRLAPESGLVRTAPEPDLGFLRVGALEPGFVRLAGDEASLLGALPERPPDDAAFVDDPPEERAGWDARLAGGFELGELLELLEPTWKEQPPRAIPKVATMAAERRVRSMSFIVRIRPLVAIRRQPPSPYSRLVRRRCQPERVGAPRPGDRWTPVPRRHASTCFKVRRPVDFERKNGRLEMGALDPSRGTHAQRCSGQTERRCKGIWVFYWTPTRGVPVALTHDARVTALSGRSPRKHSRTDRKTFQ